MLIIRKAFYLFSIACAAIFLFVMVSTAEAQTAWQDSFRHLDHPRIKSFSVEMTDITLAYPNTVDLDLPDEHTTLFLVLPWWHRWEDRHEETYLLFGSSKVSATGTGGAVALETADLTHFDSAANRGYPDQLMFPPVPLTMCDGIHDQEFDENYAGPGSVLPDPTRPPGNMIMIYEAENHCPGGNNQHSYYATVGFEISSDGGRTWPSPVNSEFGDAMRHPVFKSAIAEPSTNSNTPLGNAIPSGFIDINERGEAYLYVTYGNHDGNPADDSLRVGRAKLGKVYPGFGENKYGIGDAMPIPYDKLEFFKWYNGGFSQPGIGGLDTSVLPSTGCPGHEQMGEITHNDDLGLYMMIFVCNPSSKGNAAWYYSTATSLELEDWTVPQLVANSERAITSPCNLIDNTGSRFDGFYPSFMSPGEETGHTRLSGRAFFMNGCDTGGRKLGSRAFVITTEP
jgi:hypothetical protein